MRKIKFLIFLFCYFAGSLSFGNVGAESAQQNILAKTAKLEKVDPWRAAVTYCRLARTGSLEAHYRLGMLYAFGQGVPEDRTVAASLFASAAQQGHNEASNMLDTIRYTSERLPDCVLSDKIPARGYYRARWTNDASLDAVLSSLAKNRQWLVNMIEQIALWHRVDPRLALAVVSVESAFRVNAKSKANAMGLMQLIPATAARFNVQDAFDASQNVKGGVRYLRWLLDRYHNNVELVAAAYNAGEGAVDKYKGIPPYQETQQYVTRILHRYQSRTHSFKTTTN